MKRPACQWGGGGGYSYDHSYTPYCDIHEPTNK